MQERWNEVTRCRNDGNKKNEDDDGKRKDVYCMYLDECKERISKLTMREEKLI